MTPNPSTLAHSDCREAMDAARAAALLTDAYSHITDAATQVRYLGERSDVLSALARAEDLLNQVPYGTPRWVAVRAARVGGILIAASRLAASRAVDFPSPVAEAIGDLLDTACTFSGNLATYAQDEARAYAEEGPDA